MTWDQYLRIAAIFLVAVTFSAGGAAAMSVIAETQTISNAEYPVCTAPCECISESDAAMRWGAEGYEMCSKSICGQTADAMIQYYCIHQKGGTVSQTAVTTTAVATTIQETTVQGTTMQAPITSAAPVAATTVTSVPPAPIPTKSPLGAAAVLAVIGAGLLAAAGMRRK